MERFAETAASLLEAAEAAAAATAAPAEMTILFSPEGRIHMIADSDWPLDSLASHHGAQMAYRVRQSPDGVRLEGRAGNRKCFFESQKMSEIARRLLPEAPRPEPLRAETWLTPRAVWG